MLQMFFDCSSSMTVNLKYIYEILVSILQKNLIQILKIQLLFPLIDQTSLIYS